MGTLTGILLDVSYSMQNSASEKIDEEGGEWARSIFEVIDNFVKYDISLDDKIFAFGVGAIYGTGVFDIIKTIEQFKFYQLDNGKENDANPTYDDILETFYKLMECNGAYNTKEWAPKCVIKDAMSYKMAFFLLCALKSDVVFLEKFVQRCLPEECRDKGDFDSLGGLAKNFLQFGFAKIGSKFRSATKEDIHQCAEKAKQLLLKAVGSVFSVKNASEILHGCINEDQLNNDRITELIEIVEQFIYGNTPLCLALHEATMLFGEGEYQEHKKLLFVLSDGNPTDSLKFSIDPNVIVVSCFITSKRIEAKQLYNVEKEEWSCGGKFLFNLSSAIPTQLLPRAILIKRGWSFEITDNETKLFLQINHPENIRDVCDLAKNVVCCQDSLSDLLVSVSLDIYINGTISDFQAPEQFKGTCYANASAAVLHLSMMRILGRNGVYPDFDTLRHEIIKKYKEKGANTLKVLKEFTKKYNLQCEQVDIAGAKKAVVEKRPVVARFRLTETEWSTFKSFFKSNPTGILTRAQIDIRQRVNQQEPKKGHAVVFSSFNGGGLRFMNSWSHRWGDKGFFRVENSEILGFDFIDVFWELTDLSSEETKKYASQGGKEARKIYDKMISLQSAKYKCPECNETSPVVEYSGTLEAAVCPKCKMSVRCNEAGNILAMNIYLTSLAN